MAAPQEVIFFDPQVAMHNVIKITFFPSRLHVASNYEENVGVCGGGGLLAVAISGQQMSTGDVSLQRSKVCT